MAPVSALLHRDPHTEALCMVVFHTLLGVGALCLNIVTSPPYIMLPRDVAQISENGGLPISEHCAEASIWCGVASQPRVFRLNLLCTSHTHRVDAKYAADKRV